MILASLVVTGALLSSGLATDSLAARDSLGVKDSLAAHADSLRTRPDSLFHYPVPPLVGSLDHRMEPERTIAGDAFPRHDVRYLGDAVASMPGVYVRDQQSPGQYNQINAQGVDWRGVGMLLDGRPLNDPGSGTYNLFLFPQENVELVETVTGSEAFLYGLNSTGAAVNLVTRNFDSNIPRTKLLLSVSSYSFESSDASFHQNISQRLNLSFGLRAMNTDGRFPNSAAKLWNVRGKIRFHLLPNVSLYVSDHYTSTKTELFGGVDYARTDPAEVFSPILATIANPNAYEKLTRHDLTATVAGRFTADSTELTRLTLYYSSSLREYRDGESVFSSLVETIKDDQRTSWSGGSLAQALSFGPHRILGGISFEEQQIEGSPQMGRHRLPAAAGWIKDRVGLGSFFELSLFGRADRYLDRHALGAGARLRARIGDILTLSAGASRSGRFPTALELYWTDSTVSRPATPSNETHTVVEAGAEIMSKLGSIEATLYRRIIDHPILLEPFGSGLGMRVVNGGTTTVNGIDLRLMLRIWLLTLEGTGSYTGFSGNDARDRYPLLFGQGGLYFEHALFDGHLGLKTGIRGSGQVRQSGERFNAQRLSYIRNIGYAPGAGAKIDLVLLAHIGSADLHVIWENVTGSVYFATPYFPVMDRQVRFGVTWGFIN